jgi:hypothetical protein
VLAQQGPREAPDLAGIRDRQLGRRHHCSPRVTVAA